MSLSSNNAVRGLWTGTQAATTATVTVGNGNNTQALAVPLKAEVNVVGTSSATADTGVRLPAGVIAGDTVLVFNNTANAVAVYPVKGGAVDALTADAAFAVAAGKKAVFTAVSGKNWVAILSA